MGGRAAPLPQLSWPTRHQRRDVARSHTIAEVNLLHAAAAAAAAACLPTCAVLRCWSGGEGLRERAWTTCSDGLASLAHMYL